VTAVSSASQHPSAPLAAATPVRIPAFGWVLLIFALALTVYYPALHGSLVWDDDGHVTKPELRSLHGLERIWFEVGATQQYYPVLHSAFWLEHRLWGDATLGYHLLNVLLHATAACLFVLVLRRIWPSRSGIGFDAPLVAGLLFTLHPICVESVAWISEQKNTLSTVFYLASAIAYLRWRDSRARPSLYWLACVLFILAALSKTVTASLPAALLVVAWWQRGRLDWRDDVRPLAPWFAFGAGAGVLTAWVEHRFIGAQGADFSLGAIARCLLAGRVVWFYLGKLLWPAHLVFIYPRWTMSASVGLFLYPAALLALLAALWAIRGRTRGPLAALLFFVGSLFPALGFINVYPFRYSFVADHFQYLASLGFFALAAAGWEAIRRRAAPWPSLATAGAVLVLGACGVLARAQSRTYADGDTLYRETLLRNPDSWLAHNNLANDLLATGRWDEAIVHYREAERLDPTRPEAASNLGIALGRTGRFAEAVAPLERALQLRPDYAEAHYNLAVALANLGRLPEAIAHYGAALQLSPRHAEIHDGLGMALARSGRAPEAIEQFGEAIQLEPADAGAYGNLGTLLRLTGQNEAAIPYLRQALRLQPNLIAAHYNLSLALRAEGQIGAAEAEAAEVARLQSGRPSH
jgi:Flp pilus assembly protein TadD